MLTTSKQSSPLLLSRQSNTRSKEKVLELWGGVECTFNRVGDVYFDQLERSGHATRLEDLDLFAELGIKAMRYPILWERHAPQQPDAIDWVWADERLGRLRELNIKPIAGLLHHGNGPRYTNLLDPNFPSGLAGFALSVARRYPWVEDYTPINEPLTTARFCGLYGHWYPHGFDGPTFCRILLNECRAVVLAMRAVRQVNPKARLVQTEDIGKAYSTPPLSYQAEFENHRRWLTFDLLCGRLNRDHPLWDYFHAMGIATEELEVFLDEPCPPDVIGIDYYVSSERFLDDRLEHYAPHEHGGNERHQYADVAAVRVCAEGLIGLDGIARETWERYGLPIAMTEAHLGCTREEQMRWIMEVWQTAHQLSHDGLDIKAVTAWALLGAHDWDTLVTCNSGLYEPGAFDLRGPNPRPTAIARMLRELGQGRNYQHPVLSVPGWWQRPERLLYPPLSREQHALSREPHATLTAAVSTASPPTGKLLPTLESKLTTAFLSLVPRSKARAKSRAAQPLLITGAAGTLGSALVRLCNLRGLPHCALTHRELDIADAAAVAARLDELKPWAIINAAGYINIESAQRYPHNCLRANTQGATILANASAQRGIQLMTFSSDQVFDGAQSKSYVESDAVAPLNVYGRSQAEAEQMVLATLPAALIIRMGALFGPWDERNFLTYALRTLAAGHPLALAEDAVISPTYVPDLVQASLDLLIDGESGLWHLSSPGAVTWVEWVQQAAALAGIDASRIEPRPAWAMGLNAPRALYNVLGSERGELLQPLENALCCYAD
ncbi:MAG: sugar nucleotide-binding protein, partial [Abitibacteriaceae bacterium]|nr:sugar nucleotide-binding protein [Abditibacteriaceae bacterium]